MSCRKGSESLKTDKILERFAVNGELISALFLTYNFDIQFFTEDFLPALLGVETPPNQNVEFLDELRGEIASKEISVIVNTKDFLAERNKVANTVYRWPQTIGYHLFRSNHVCFHPKVYLLIYAGGQGVNARLVIGSANLTLHGMRRQAETFSVFELNKDHATHRTLFQELYGFLSILLGDMRRSESDFRIMGHLRGILEECTGDFEPKIRLLHSIGGTSLLSQIEKETKGEKVRRIKIVSPFFEDDLPASGDVKGTLFGRVFGLTEASCCSDIEAIDIYFASTMKDGVYLSGLPMNILKSLGKTNLLKARFFAVLDEENGVRRFKHGKLLIIETDKETLVLSGSANFSRRALLGTAPTANVEACILQRLRKGQKLDILPRSEMVKFDKIEAGEKTYNFDEIPNTQPELFLVEAVLDVKKKELTIYFDFECEPQTSWKLLLDDKTILSSGDLDESLRRSQKLVMLCTGDARFLVLEGVEFGCVKFPIRLENQYMPQFDLSYDQIIMESRGYPLSYVHGMATSANKAGASSGSQSANNSEERINDFFKALDGIRGRLDRYSRDKFADVRMDLQLKRVLKLIEEIRKRRGCGADSLAKASLKIAEIIRLLRSAAKKSLDCFRSQIEHIVQEAKKILLEMRSGEHSDEVFVLYSREVGGTNE